MQTLIGLSRNPCSESEERLCFQTLGSWDPDHRRITKAGSQRQHTLSRKWLSAGSSAGVGSQTPTCDFSTVCLRHSSWVPEKTVVVA